MNCNKIKFDLSKQNKIKEFLYIFLKNIKLKVKNLYKSVSKLNFKEMEIIKNIEQEQVLFIVNFLEDDNKDEIQKTIKDFKKEEKIEFIIHPTCYFCCKTFKNQSELDLHKKECDLHQESTKLKSNESIVKKRVKTYNKTHICEICNVSCSTASDHAFHMMSHKDVDQPLVQKCFVCSICKKTILGVESMKRHRRRHLEVKNYKCDQCPRAFNCASLLKVHSRGLLNLILFLFFLRLNCFFFEIAVHTGERPYSCKYCNGTFSVKSNCVAHEIRHSTGAVKKFTCVFPNCYKEFLQKTGLTYHISKSHGKSYALVDIV